MNLRAIFACALLPIVLKADPTPRTDLRFDGKMLITQASSTKIYIHNPRDPDTLFMGFFPIWAAILVALTSFCLILALIGTFCWLLGCNNPRRVLEKEASMLREQQEQQDIEEQFYDDISMRMLDTLDKNHSSLFNDSRLVSEYEIDSKLKKKKFRSDHL